MELYRLFDAEGTLLYVGISHSAIARYAQHKERQPWIKSVARIQIEDLGAVDRQEALEQERQAIVAEKPKHNVIHNSTRAQANKQVLPATRTTDCSKAVQRSGRKSDHFLFVCDQCDKPIHRGDGYVQCNKAVTSTKMGRRYGTWSAVHRDCDYLLDSETQYWIAVERISTEADLERWQEHLDGKDWFGSSKSSFMWVVALARMNKAAADGGLLFTQSHQTKNDHEDDAPERFRFDPKNKVFFLDPVRGHQGELVRRPGGYNATLFSWWSGEPNGKRFMSDEEFEQNGIVTFANHEMFIAAADAMSAANDE